MLYGQNISYQVKIGGGFASMVPIMISLPLVANFLEPGAGFGVCMTLLLIFGGIGGIT